MKSFVILGVLGLIAQALCLSIKISNGGVAIGLGCNPGSIWESPCYQPCRCQNDGSIIFPEPNYPGQCNIKRRCVPRTQWRKDDCRLCYCLDSGVPVCERKCSRGNNNNNNNVNINELISSVLGNRLPI